MLRDIRAADSVTNFSVSMKQTTPPGNYQLNLNTLDDNVTVF
jgi:hypothetical protein